MRRYKNHTKLIADLEKDLEVMDKKNMQYAIYQRGKEHITGERSWQMLAIASGEGGCGKSKMVLALVKKAKIEYGKTVSLFGPILVIGPTGSASYGAGARVLVI